MHQWRWNLALQSDQVQLCMTNFSPVDEEIRTWELRKKNQNSRCIDILPVLQRCDVDYRFVNIAVPGTAVVAILIEIFFSVLLQISKYFNTFVLKYCMSYCNTFCSIFLHYSIALLFFWTDSHTTARFCRGLVGLLLYSLRWFQDDGVSPYCLAVIWIFTSFVTCWRWVCTARWRYLILSNDKCSQFNFIIVFITNTL